MSLEILKRELSYVKSRIILIRQGKVSEAKGLTLVEAMKREKDFESAIKLVEKNM